MYEGRIKKKATWHKAKRVFLQSNDVYFIYAAALTVTRIASLTHPNELPSADTALSVKLLVIRLLRSNRYHLKLRFIFIP